MSIVSISDVDVSKITSGQVIVDLKSVVKELVDNSIDSGCDKLEVTFNNHGLKSVEISDNGSGIEVFDFENLCLKHHTSKLSNFEDLSSVATLGFRGEAMSSLCAMAKVKVTTCSKTTFPKGTQLDYDSMGKLVSKKTMLSGKKGTSVSISELFNGMPVRQKNFAKHIKREYTKTLSLLQEYLLAYTKIRFTVFNISGATGKKSLVMGTQGGQSSVTSVLTTIYGSNAAYGLMPVEIKIKDIDARFKINSSMVPMALDICLTGVLSDCSFGMGRAATDRQYISVNNRPITHKKITKIINEVYKSFNTTQCPVFVLNLQLDSRLLDVNVTPDKRSVMMQCENVICEVIREEVVLLYEGRNNFVPKSQMCTVNMGSSPVASQHETLKRFRSSADSFTDTPTTPLKSTVDMSKDIGEILPKSSLEVTRIILNENEQPENSVYQSTPRKTGSPYIDDLEMKNHNIQTETFSDLQPNGNNEVSSDNFEDVDFDDLGFSLPVRNIEIRGDAEYEPTQIENPKEVTRSLFVSEFDNKQCLPNVQSALRSFNTPVRDKQIQHVSSERYENVDEKSDSESFYSLKSLEGDEVHEDSSSNPNKGKKNDAGNNNVPASKSENCKNPSTTNQPIEQSHDARNNHDISTSRENVPDNVNQLQGIQVPLQMAIKRPNDHFISLSNKQSNSNTLASIQDISETMEIRKEDFMKMEIVGQFNSGFIIVTHDNKLFIVDQHASDEIFNYEKKMKELTFKPQPLVAPQILELSPIDEMKILDFADLLSENGFAIEEIEGAAPGRRVKLVGIPVSKSIVFDVSDLHELVHKLHEQGASLGARSTRIKTEMGSKRRSTLSVCRCTKVDRMIASRACRSSIMIGQTLSKQTMSKVVKNLAVLDRPWNCPHGRPTMRHLADIQGASFSMDYQL